MTHEPGFDRFVIQFDGVYVPAFAVKRQAKPVFTDSGSGQSITLSGTSGVLVQLKSTSQASGYSGPADFTQAGFPILKEARLTDASEGVVQWALGLGTAACMRVFTATTPPARLIIDFATASS